MCYLADCTNPDIEFAKTFFSLYTLSMSTHHSQLLKNPLRYLKLTATFFLLFSGAISPHLITTYSYSDFATSAIANLHSELYILSTMP